MRSTKTTRILFLAAFILLRFPCFSADVPSWVKKPEKEFPSSVFIRALGEGDSAKAAQSAAIAEISLFFDTKTEVVTEAVKGIQLVSGNGGLEKRNSQSIAQVAEISSCAEFFGAQFTDSYFDKKKKKHFVLAYLNRNDAALLYKSRISALMGAVASYRAEAFSCGEPFVAERALSKAVVLAPAAERYIHAETTIIPADTKTYAESLGILSSLPAECSAMKKNVSFSVSVSGDGAEKFPSISTVVSSVAAKKGYVSSASGSALYDIVVEVSASEENFEIGPFVRPSLDISIRNKSGAGVYSYSKQFPRVGAKTLDMAYTRAFVKIKQDVEENFLSE